MTAVVASGSTLQHGQTSLSSQIATLSDMVEKLQLQQNQSILANTTSFATTPAQALYEPTSNPPRLPSPTSRLRRDPGDPELPPCIRFGEVNKPYYLLSCAPVPFKALEHSSPCLAETTPIGLSTTTVLPTLPRRTSTPPTDSFRSNRGSSP